MYQSYTCIYTLKELLLLNDVVFHLRIFPRYYGNFLPTLKIANKARTTNETSWEKLPIKPFYESLVFKDNVCPFDITNW